jgi:hypothetical protein
MKEKETKLSYIGSIVVGAGFARPVIDIIENIY